MNKAPVEYNVAKIAKMAGYVNDSTPEFELLKKAMRIHKQREEHLAAIAKLESI